MNLVLTKYYFRRGIMKCQGKKGICKTAKIPRTPRFLFRRQDFFFAISNKTWRPSRAWWFKKTTPNREAIQNRLFVYLLACYEAPPGLAWRLDDYGESIDYVLTGRLML
jgi:hypothetical protein